ncbi:Protein sel-1 1 [Thelohanellus kitauei]|uniref:Protein sel-1 1 n=1 Tax=Thelohanellus kitauei TaxID=669202 RepID=A0A0C2J5Y6_THEKT|nr:Protein sel-1 1 [Thelohanellus kitauei]
MFSTLILLLPSIFPVRPLEDDFRQILLHLKPQKADGAIEIKTQLDDLYRVINSNFDESNISAFYDVAYNDTKFANFALSIFHNWGLGVEEDDRIAVLRLNLGVLEDDLVSFLSFNHKSLLGLNVPKSCQANLRTYKNIVNAKNNQISEEPIVFSSLASYLGMVLLYFYQIYLKFFDHDENYIKEAYKLFKESEDIPYSHLGFGILYFYGLGVETNYTIAFQHFIQANRSGLVEASTYLAISYLMGLGVTPDSQQALKSAMVAANRGYLLALYALGFMHEKGIGVFHSCRYAAEMYSVIIEHKLLKNYVSEAVRDYQNGQVLRALFKFLIFSEMGSSYALINAAGIIEKHKFKFFGSENRLKKLFKIWKHAAMLGLKEF